MTGSLCNRQYLVLAAQCQHYLTETRSRLPWKHKGDPTAGLSRISVRYSTHRTNYSRNNEYVAVAHEVFECKIFRPKFQDFVDLVDNRKGLVDDIVQSDNIVATISFSN